jgi:hypothetical protein
LFIAQRKNLIKIIPNPLFVIEIANLIELGTEEDENAFDKQHLPVAKEILFKLLDCNANR